MASGCTACTSFFQYAYFSHFRLFSLIPYAFSSKLNTENRGISFKDKRPFDRWNTSLLQIYWVTNGNSKYECQGPASRYLIHNCIWYTLYWNAYIYWLPKCFFKKILLELFPRDRQPHPLDERTYFSLSISLSISHSLFLSFISF